jgi:hypothetical protein
VLSTAAFPDVAVANRWPGRGLGPAWPIVTLAIFIALWWVLILGGGAADPHALTVALCASVPVPGKLLVV